MQFFLPGLLRPGVHTRQAGHKAFSAGVSDKLWEQGWILFCEWLGGVSCALIGLGWIMTSGQVA